MGRNALKTSRPEPIYTREERARRDGTVWTQVQGALAPIQFMAFLVSLVLIGRFLATGEGLGAANASIVVKTGLLFTIMATGAIWEKVVFGQYLFARPFFWEDVISMAVIALHLAYLVAYFLDLLTAPTLMALALAAYATYVVNAGQFLLKLRRARLDRTEATAVDAVAKDVGLEPAR